MKTTLYADVLFLVNFSMDYISLWAAAMLGAKIRKAWRMSLSAALGGLFGVLSVVFSLNGAVTYITAAVVSILMCLTAFGWCGGIAGVLKQSALIWGCGALLGGLMTALLTVFGKEYTYAGNENAAASAFAPLAAAAAGAVYLTVRLINSKRGAGIYEVSISVGGCSITFNALSDSGNLMRDPISGDPCVLLSDVLCRRLIGDKLTDALISCNTDTLSESSLRFRIIPHKSADKNTLTAAFLPDKAAVRKKGKNEQVRLLVMPHKGCASYFGGYPATFPASLSLK